MHRFSSSPPWHQHSCSKPELSGLEPVVRDVHAVPGGRGLTSVCAQKSHGNASPAQLAQSLSHQEPGVLVVSWTSLRVRNPSPVRSEQGHLGGASESSDTPKPCACSNATAPLGWGLLLGAVTLQPSPCC